MTIEIDEKLVELLEKDLNFQKIESSLDYFNDDKSKKLFKYAWITYESKKWYPALIKDKDSEEIGFEINPSGWGGKEKQGKKKISLAKLLSIVINRSYKELKVRCRTGVVSQPNQRHIKDIEFNNELKILIDKYRDNKNKKLIEIFSPALAIKEISSINEPIFTKEEIKSAEQVVEDIEIFIAGFEGEERDAIAKLRVNQGKFRQVLLSHWDNTCAVSGLKEEKLLIASHILPWSKSTKHQKGDLSNGLLLSVVWDSLFDKGLISFDDNGQAILDKLSNEIKECLGLTNEPYTISSKKLTPEHKQYLKMHRMLHEFI